MAEWHARSTGDPRVLVEARTFSWDLRVPLSLPSSEWVPDLSWGKQRRLCVVMATETPRMPLATETGERCFTSPIDQMGLTGTLLFFYNII